MTNKDRSYYAQMYLEIISEQKQENFSLEDLEAAFLSGWSNAVMRSNSEEINTLLDEIKSKIKEELSDA